RTRTIRTSTVAGRPIASTAPRIARLAAELSSPPPSTAERTGSRLARPMPSAIAAALRQNSTSQRFTPPDEKKIPRMPLSEPCCIDGEALVFKDLTRVIAKRLLSEFPMVRQPRLGPTGDGGRSAYYARACQIVIARVEDEVRMQNFAPAGLTMPDDVAALDRLTRARFSCRAYLPDPVPRETIESILRMAQRAPSWCNSQAWQLVITSGEATERFREALYAHATSGAEEAADLDRPREYRGVYLKRRRECGFQL